MSNLSDNFEPRYGMTREQIDALLSELPDAAVGTFGLEIIFDQNNKAALTAFTMRLLFGDEQISRYAESLPDLAPGERCPGCGEVHVPANGAVEVMTVVDQAPAYRTGMYL